MKLLLLLISFFLLQGCASDSDVAHKSAKITVAFRAANPTFKTKDHHKQDSLEWHITTAVAWIGEIGIHWDWYSTQSMLPTLRHDIPGGKISPKIYDYYAVDFLKDTHIQTLQVEPKIYNHVHMMMTPATSDTIKNIKKFPKLKNRSYYFAGTVSDGNISKEFEVYSDSLYKENDLGDIQFELPIQDGESYNFNLTAPLKDWFGYLNWVNLGGDSELKVTLNKNTHSIGAGKFESIVTADSSFAFNPQQVK